MKRFLGEGGKKKVFLVTDSLLDRDVAFSLIKTEGLDDTGIERIKREAQLMGRLGDHPHIVSLYDIGEENGQPYLVSQLMGGGDVEGLIEDASEHRPPLPDTLRIADQVCQALEYAHRHGVIHRDLKPGNVWLTSDGTAKLGDFGLAIAIDRTRLSIAGMIVGTVTYMPPEQALGRPSDGRSDLYSLGAMLYEMVTGRPPFLGDDPVAVISQHINTQPVAPTWHTPGLPRPLEQLILSLLAKAPEDRPESASEVREQLEAIRSVLDQRESGSAQEAEISESRNPLDRLAAGVFVGREKELGHLRASVDAALGGTGQIVLLAGEPGIGKTSLAEEITTYARLRGAQVLWSRSYEWQGAPAYWAWVQLIRAYVHAREPQQLKAELGAGGNIIAHVVSEVRALLPDLPAAPPFEGEEARFRLFDAVASFLRTASRNQPLVLVLDDLHWADAPSLLLLQYVARELRDARVLILGGYRDIEVGRQHPLAATLAELAREQRLERITLRGLTREEIARYIELTAGKPPATGLVDAIVDQTAGNPFFVAEVVRLLVSEGALERDGGDRWSVTLPQGVREVVGRRLDRLSAECNELLAVAAVIGREFDLRLLSNVVEQPLDAVLETLESALAARLVRTSDLPDHYRFNQELIQEVLYAELSIARRRRLNSKIARALETIHAGNLAPHYAQLAHHYAAAGQREDAEKAIDYAHKAGERAMTQYAWEAAITHFEQALEVAESHSALRSEVVCKILLELGSARNLVAYYGNSPETRDIFLRAAMIARRTGNAQDFARAALGFAGENSFATFGGGLQLSLLDEARERLGPADSELRATVLGRLAIDRRNYRDDYETAVELAAEATEIAVRLEDDITLQKVLLWRYAAIWLPENAETLLALSERLLRVAERMGDPNAIWLALRIKAANYLTMGNVAEAKRISTERDRIVEAVFTPFVARLIPRVGTLWALLDGRLSDADRYIAEQAPLMPRDVWAYGSQLTQLRREQERLGELMSQLDAFRQEELPHTSLDEPILLEARIITCMLEIDKATARERFSTLSAYGFINVPKTPGWFEIMALMSDACVALGDQKIADRLYQLLLPIEDLIAFGWTAFTCWAPVHHYLGKLATAQGQWEAAERHFESAIQIEKREEMNLWRAHSDYSYSDMLVHRGEPGDQEQALVLVDQALAEAEAMDAVRLARQALALKVQIQGILKA